MPGTEYPGDAVKAKRRPELSSNGKKPPFLHQRTEWGAAGVGAQRPGRRQELNPDFPKKKVTRSRPPMKKQELTLRTRYAELPKKALRGWVGSGRREKERRGSGTFGEKPHNPVRPLKNTLR